VLCSQDGNVIGMHQETVNEAIELAEGETDPMEVNKSIVSLVKGLSQGFIALRLDTEVVKTIIGD
jgi:hypothetical protein